MKKLMPILLLMLLWGCRAASTVADMTYVDRAGARHSICNPSTPLTLVYLNDIDCDECHAVGDSLRRSSEIAQAVCDSRLRVLSVYVGDQSDRWAAMDPTPGWVECIDTDFASMATATYQFESLPALFIVDSHSRMRQQNISAKDAINYIATHSK
ncbi:MAG: hypothetical protein ACI31D_06030 [Candidatus Limisoma sp.]